ncbi:MAG TPA: DNA-binding protein YbiB [Burkholderiales bacterium]|jgi:anthranilate phosphoribosyltransferase|nr:DNA-binding protein YbiB [Burkholderiales bacterium]
MSAAHALKTLSRHERLSEESARQVAAALLDGGVPEFEQGALLALLDSRSDELSETAGSASALTERCFHLKAPSSGVRPVVLASHAGTTTEPNLLALLAVTLQRLKLPVVVHGALGAPGRVVAGQILRELGVMPCLTLHQAQTELETAGIAFVPTAVLSPGLADLLSLRGRLGFGAYAERLGRFVDPFAGGSLVVIAAADEQERRLLRAVLCERPGSYLLLESSHGEAFADPRRRPRLELIRDGKGELLFEAEAGPLRSAVSAPQSKDARSTASWTRSVLRGERPMPLPIVNQVACCLYGAGYTVDMNQAKAIVAVQTGSLLAA